MASTWTSQATYTTTVNKSLVANRNMVCFEVLDFDSLTHVSVNDEYKDVVALIYKRITIEHIQNRTFAMSRSHETTNCKGYEPDSMTLTYYKILPANDSFTYTGSRKVEYILCLIVGAEKYTINLGELNIATTGQYNVTGKNVELIEDGCDDDFPPCTYAVDNTNPAFTVTGIDGAIAQRLYGVSINCGKEAVTYSYDVEELDTTKSFDSNVNFYTDSPLNLEDTNINDCWVKKHRVVGAMNYLGIYESKTFDYSSFADEVLAVGYGKI